MKKGSRRKLSGAAKRAFLARMAAGRRKARRPARAGGKSRTNPKRRSPGGRVVYTKAARSASSHPSPGAVFVISKKRKSGGRRPAHRNPPRPGRRRARRNPPLLSVRGMIGDTMQGVKDVAALEAGRMVTNFVSRLVPVTSVPLAIGARIVVGFIGSRAVQMVVGRDAARLYLAGAWSVPLESGVRALNVPLLTGALASDEEVSRYFNTIGMYPAGPTRTLARGGMGMYPAGPATAANRRAGVGDAGGNTTMMTQSAAAGGSSFF